MKKLLFEDHETIWKSTIVKRVENKRWNVMVECMCECWNIFICRLSDLRSSKQTSCWCNKWGKRHWMKWTRFYNIRCWIKNRCNCKSHHNYRYYWWRWINLSKEWLKFDYFFRDMYDDYVNHVLIYWEKQTQIYRINIDKWYSSYNCRWVTIKEQANNRRNNLK